MEMVIARQGQDGCPQRTKNRHGGVALLPKDLPLVFRIHTGIVAHAFLTSFLLAQALAKRGSLIETISDAFVHVYYDCSLVYVL